jgi:hypothetical protein
MKVRSQSRLKPVLLVIVLFCCIASVADSMKCYGLGTVASSPGVGSCLETPNPSAKFTVPYYAWYIAEIDTYHGWVGQGSQPQGYMTIADDAGNIYYQGLATYMDETPGGTAGGWWLGHLVAKPKIVLPAGNYILSVDSWQTWKRPASAGGCSHNSYGISGMPCAELSQDQCLACGNSMIS